MLHLYVYVDDAVAVENEQTIDERTGRQASVRNCTTSHKSLCGGQQTNATTQKTADLRKRQAKKKKEATCTRTLAGIEKAAKFEKVIYFKN